MIIFESRKTSHVSKVVECNILKLWGLHFTNTSEENQKSFEIGINSLKEELLSLGNLKHKEVGVYLYKPESYFHPTYLKTVANLLLGLSKIGVKIFLESNSGSLINEFGYQIELGCVPKDSVRVFLETSGGSDSYRLLELGYDTEGVLHGLGGEPYPVGYFN